MTEILDATPGAQDDVAGARAAGGFDYEFSDKVVLLADADGIEAETFAALRNHLIVQHVRDGRRGLAICAPRTDVGSTYIATNLAVAMAQSGLNTLLIDANLRSPGVHEMIVPHNPGIGLSDYLRSDDESSVRGLIRSQVIPNLSVIYAGSVGGVTQEMLAGRRFEALIDECLRAYDLTIIDCPPSSESGDARRIASLARYALVVARKNISIVSDIRTLIGELQGEKVKVIGSFLNDFDGR